MMLCGEAVGKQAHGGNAMEGLQNLVVSNKTLSILTFQELLSRNTCEEHENTHTRAFPALLWLQAMETTRMLMCRRMSRSQCMLGEYYSCKNMRTSGENTEGQRASLACYLTCKKGRQVRNHVVNLQEVVGMRRERTRIGEQK